MATTKIVLENGFFKYGDPLYVNTNGWNCFIAVDGSVLCEAARDYSDGVHSIRYLIKPNGFAKLTLKIPYQRVKTLRKGYVLPKGRKLSDGVIGLAGGKVDERYAYFRDRAFQDFLDAHGITAVKREDPNQEFFLRHANYGGGSCSSHLLSDGKVTEVSYNSGRTDRWEELSPGTCAEEGSSCFQVSGARWALHKQSQHEGNSHNCFSILYTLEDPTKLVGLPNV